MSNIIGIAITSMLKSFSSARPPRLKLPPQYQQTTTHCTWRDIKFTEENTK